jgi:UDP-3-O-[3-hydroxymyristoyl] glucosamine N-acyltransferase
MTIQISYLRRLISIFLKHRKIDIIIFVYEWLLFYVMRIISTSFFCLKCKIYGIVIGSGSKVWGKVLFRKYPGSSITIGNNVYIISSPLRYSFNIFPQSKLQTLSKSAKIIIGKNVSFNSLTILARSKTISIGDGTLIGGNCQIFDTDGHQIWPADERFTNPGFDADRSVSIGKNVFIGLNVLIMKNVEIGDNSIIAAGSIVTKSIPENCVAAGVPAKVISTH